jgi:signal transduction histidine kinase
VWVLGLVSPPRDGLTSGYVATYSLLLLAIAVVDQLAPTNTASTWRRVAFVLIEIVLCALVVRTQGTLIRPALIYLLPVGRAILLLGERRGLAVSLLVWVGYAINIAPGAWPDHLSDFANYLSFFLAPYAVAITLCLAIVRQEQARQRIQSLYDQLRLAHTELQALHAEVRSAAVAEERNRLAREIHDSLAHYLTVANVQLEAAEKLGASRAEAALEHVHRARRLTLDCLQDVRRSVAALRSATLEELAPEQSLRRLVFDFGASTGIHAQFRSTVTDGSALAPEQAQTLYRAVQEGLTNVQRHAHATQVCISLARVADGVELLIDDDGVGPMPRSDGLRHAPSGFGLLGLRERVALLEGQLEFGPAPGGGSRLRMCVPTRHSVGAL